MVLPPVRKATRKDGPVILRLVDALANYEKLAPPDTAAKERLINDMAGERPRFDAYLCEVDGVAAGYSFVFEAYSSFRALPTLYLEDLFVLPEYRKKKVGYALFVAMLAEAHRRGCGRMEWTVLDWNSLAIDFYKRLGASYMKEWHHYRIDRVDMQKILVSNSHTG